MADEVAPGDGAEEVAEGAEEVISVEGAEEVASVRAEAEIETAAGTEILEVDAVVDEVEVAIVEDTGDAEVVEVVAEVEVVETEVLEVDAEVAEVEDGEVEVVESEVVEAEVVDVVEAEAVLASEAVLELEAETADEPAPGPEAAATEIIALVGSAEASEPAPAPQAPAGPAASATTATPAAYVESDSAAPTTALPGMAQALASASFVPPQPPAARPAESPATPPAPRTVTLAGRQVDRRAALIAGGVGVVVIGGAVAAFASSGSSSTAPTASSTGHAAAGSPSAKASMPASVPLPTITTSPADGASGVDPSKPITVTVLNGTIDSVALSGQEQTNGTLSTDGATWTSANALDVNASYQLTVTAKNSAGKTKSTVVSFHTLLPSATFGVDSVVPPRGSTVGVGQPIRVTFSNYVPTEYKAALEKACVVTTEPAVAGAWYWVSNSTDGAVLDWRPKDFWAVNTKVSIAFNLNGVRLGEHQFGVKDYAAHDFSIRDTDLRLIVDKDTFSATCYQNGKVIRTFPIDTGMLTEETFVTYTGTMSVLGKGNPVEMKGNYGPGDTYDDFVNWATQITWSGTYVHAAPWDGDIGRANDDSHGCVHCRAADAEWFYNIVQNGDVVTINGSRKREVAVDNGICTFTLDWAGLLKGSAYGATLNGKPVSA